MTIEELAERAAVPVRTVRFYIAEGMLPSSGARGKASLYGMEHLLRLTLIRRLVDQHIPLREIKIRLAILSANEIRALLAEDVQREEDLRRAEMSPKTYVSTLLSRARLMRESSGPQSLSGSISAQPSPAEPATKDEPGAVSQPPSSTLEHRLSKRGRLETNEELPRSPTLPDSQAWQRWELLPGVELHVSNDTAERHRNLVQQLLRLAKSITG